MNTITQPKLQFLNRQVPVVHNKQVRQVVSQKRAQFKVQAETKQKGGVVHYLQEAFQSVFNVEKSDVDWSKTYAEFSGPLTQLDKERLQILAKSISDIKGCTDPKAANFNSLATVDDGSCSFSPQDASKRISLGEYLQNVIRGTWEGNFEKNNPDSSVPKFQTHSFEGRIVSQRDIEKMLIFEKAVKTAMKDKSQESLS